LLSKGSQSEGNAAQQSAASVDPSDDLPF